MTTIRILVVAIATIVAVNSYAVIPAAADWIAIGGANWKDGGGRVHAAVGYSGVRSSEREARASALAQCNSAGGSGCKILGAWPDGCIFIASGHSSTKAGYGTGDSAESAIKKCQGEELSCNKPVGGCIK